MILVTGSSGFIGRNLVASLREKGNEVVCFDTKEQDVESIPDLKDIKQIYHLGAISTTTETDLNKLYKHNIWFSVELFKKAIEHQIPVVYTSSASIFGNTMKDGRYDLNPLTYYAMTKLMVDVWIHDHLQEFSKIAVARLFNVYGENEVKDDMAISPLYRFKTQAMTLGEIRVFKGSHDMIRDFLCVDDAVTALQYLSRCAYKDFYDVGTSHPISFLDVAQMCSDKYNVPIRFIDMPASLLGKYQYYTKARNILFPMQSVAQWLLLH